MFPRILLLLCLFAPWTASADDEIRCNESGTQMEMNACARNDFEKADQELNQVYQSLLKKERKNKLFVNKLKIAQRAWIAFRDAEMEARFACSEKEIRICWGSMYPLLYFSRKTELTVERTKELQEILDDGIGQ